MIPLRIVDPSPVAGRPAQRRTLPWVFVPVFLAVHLVIATCLPERLAPLSTIFVVLAEAAAIIACIAARRTAAPSARTFWLLLSVAIGIHSIAMGLEAFTEVVQTPILNHVGAIHIFLSMLYGVPLLVAVSIQHDPRILPVARIVNAGLSIAVIAVIFFEVCSFLTVYGSANPSDALLVTYCFDAMDFFLAIAATIRWLGSSQEAEFQFFRVLAIFLWLNAVLPAVRNRILIHHDYIWLDLLIVVPYVVLVPLASHWRSQPGNFASPGFACAVRSGSFVFLAGALMLVGIAVGQSHFYVGSAAALLAIIGYGTLNIFIQSRGLETEAALLASNAALEKLVDEDGLTGIANRRAFDEVLVREFASTQRSRRPVSLLMIDVDWFKSLNDAKGHLVGDHYLVEIATALRLTLRRSTDMVARYGGEEFSVILPATDSGGALIAAEKLRRAVVSLGLGHPDSPTGIVTVSIGVSTFDGSILSTPADLLQTADRALYIAKRSGRDRSEFRRVKSPVAVVPIAAGR